MLSPICIWRAISGTFATSFRTNDWTAVSGHHFEEQERDREQACCVRVLKCVACGATKVMWSACSCKVVVASHKSTAPRRGSEQ